MILFNHAKPVRIINPDRFKEGGNYADKQEL